MGDGSEKSGRSELEACEAFCGRKIRNSLERSPREERASPQTGRESFARSVVLVRFASEAQRNRGFCLGSFSGYNPNFRGAATK